MKDIDGVQIKEYDILKATIFIGSTYDSDLACDLRRYVHAGFVLNENLSGDCSKDRFFLTAASYDSLKYPLNQEFIDYRGFKIIDSLNKDK